MQMETVSRIDRETIQTAGDRRKASRSGDGSDANRVQPGYGSVIKTGNAMADAILNGEISFAKPKGDYHLRGRAYPGGAEDFGDGSVRHYWKSL